MAELDCFEENEPIQLVVSFTADGKRYEAGWIGRVAPLCKTLAESQRTGHYEVEVRTGRYEVDPDDDSELIDLQTPYFQRSSRRRKEGELRQGDRVKLVTGLRGTQSYIEAGTMGTVICTHTVPDRLQHGVALDFLENVTVPREQLEHMPNLFARVIFADDTGVRIDFSDNRAFS